jgi:hypothetical protein
MEWCNDGRDQGYVQSVSVIFSCGCLNSKVWCVVCVGGGVTRWGQ